MGLNTSLSKTKIQNLGHGVIPAPVQLQGHIVESTDCFTYLGSDIHSSERSTSEILRRIGLASDIFGRLANVWKRTGLSLQAKIRLYNALVISVLLYGSETWTHERRLEAFHMNCQRRILGIRWFHFVTNASVTSQTGEEGLAIRICRRRLSSFGHVRRLPEATPAHSALCHAWLWTLVQAVNRTSGRSESASVDDLPQRGCSKSRTTLGSTPTTPGGSHITASLGGRYVPWPVKRSTDWLTDWLTLIMSLLKSVQK